MDLSVLDVFRNPAAIGLGLYLFSLSLARTLFAKIVWTLMVLWFVFVGPTIWDYPKLLDWLGLSVRGYLWTL